MLSCTVTNLRSLQVSNIKHWMGNAVVQFPYDGKPAQLNDALAAFPVRDPPLKKQ
jgi:hypothetical protein